MTRSHAFLNAVRLAGTEQPRQGSSRRGGRRDSQSPTARDRRRPFPQPRGETPTDTYGTHPSNGGALPWIADERRPWSVRSAQNLPAPEVPVDRCYRHVMSPWRTPCGSHAPEVYARRDYYRAPGCGGRCKIYKLPYRAHLSTLLFPVGSTDNGRRSSAIDGSAPPFEGRVPYVSVGVSPWG